MCSEKKGCAMKRLSLLLSVFLLSIPTFAGAEVVELSAGISVEICPPSGACWREELMPRQNIAIKLEEIVGMEGTFTGGWSNVVKKGDFSFKGNISVTKSVYREEMPEQVTYFVTGWFKDGAVFHNMTQRLGDLSNLVDEFETGSAVWIEGSSYIQTFTVGGKISEK